jgi:RNA methyltransferase, TrmH family
MLEQITSLQNPRIKNIIKLDKLAERKKQNLFVIEGEQEFKHAYQAEYKFDSIFICPEIFGKEQLDRIIAGKKSQTITFEISRPVYEKLAYRGSTEGIIALAHPRQNKLSELHLSNNSLILALEAVEKPGNLGAILRTADAAGIDAVVLCDPHTDLYNPNVIRSSVGCIFTVPTALCSNQEARTYFRAHQIKIYAAALTAELFYHQSDLKNPTAIIMGTESTGLSDFWLSQADTQIKIPMVGKNDSLNVSTAAAVLVFEAQRQRGFPKIS